MGRRGDSEFTISAWSPEWLDGSGVSRVGEWFVARSEGWRVSKIFDIKQEVISRPLDVVRTSGYADMRADLSHQSAGSIPVMVELSRLKKARGGPLEERIVECAASVTPCVVGLHAVDIRRPVPESVWQGKRTGDSENAFKESLAEFRALCAQLPISWATFSTFGRGVSVAELFHRRGSSAQVGAAFLGDALRPEELAELHPCQVANVDRGVEILLATQLGGPAGVVSAGQHDAIWRALRRVSLGGLPWDVTKDLGAERGP